MTVCIASIAAREHSICLVTDSKASFGSFSADGAVQKRIPLIYHYAVLVAGNDASHAGIVINRVKKRLTGGQPVTEADEISQCIFEECQEERDRIAEAEILKPHGFDLETFRSKGSTLCTDSVFYDIHAELQKNTLSLDFIIAGFDSKDIGHIRFTNCTTPPQDYDSIGFWAIGTGAQAALASLSHTVEHMGVFRWSDSEEVLYHTLAAKFMAESARDVGKETDAIIMLPSGENAIKFLHPFGGIEYVRNLWEKEGAPKKPKNLQDRMQNTLVSTVKESFSIEKLGKLAKHSKSARDLLRIRQKAKIKQLADQTSTDQ
jgi:hypothetical protein